MGEPGTNFGQGHGFAIRKPKSEGKDFLLLRELTRSVAFSRSFFREDWGRKIFGGLAVVFQQFDQFGVLVIGRPSNRGKGGCETFLDSRAPAW